MARVQFLNEILSGEMILGSSQRNLKHELTPLLNLSVVFTESGSGVDYLSDNMLEELTKTSKQLSTNINISNHQNKHN